MAVVLPAPSGPTRPYSSPRATVKPRPSSACVVPKRRRRPRALTATGSSGAATGPCLAGAPPLASEPWPTATAPCRGS